MNLKNLIFGIVVTAFLVVGLGATRLMKVTEPKELLELTEIEPITLTPPPEPLVIEQNQEVADTSPPPPSFADLRTDLSIDSITLPSANQPVSLDTEVDLFSQDLAPADLPSPIKAKPKVKPVAKRTAPKAKKSTAIGVGDLDAKPRVLRLGRFRWPNFVKEEEIRVSVVVDIDEKGRVKLKEVKSISHPEIKSTVPKLIHGFRFTPPKYKGKAVKITYDWNLVLQKP